MSKEIIDRMSTTLLPTIRWEEPFIVKVLDDVYAVDDFKYRLGETNRLENISKVTFGGIGLTYTTAAGMLDRVGKYGYVCRVFGVNTGLHKWDPEIQLGVTNTLALDDTMYPVMYFFGWKYPEFCRQVVLGAGRRAFAYMPKDKQTPELLKLAELPYKERKAMVIAEQDALRSRLVL